jgi:putative transposase
VRIVTRVTRRVQVPADSVFDLGYHVVRSPRYRRLALGGRAAGQCAELIGARASDGWRMVALEITPDHMHLFVNAHLSGSPNGIAIQVEGSTSRRWRAGFLYLRSRRSVLWAWPYRAATAGAVSAQTVRRYTGTQNERRWRKERAR